MKEYLHVGERAGLSGVYRAIHNGHRHDHSLIVIKGDEFPPCRFCKDSTLFLLVETVEYVTHDLDFAGLSQFEKTG